MDIVFFLLPSCYQSKHKLMQYLVCVLKHKYQKVQLTLDSSKRE